MNGHQLIEFSDDALGLILNIRDTFLHQKQISSITLDTEKRIVLESNELAQGLNNEKQKIVRGASQRVCSRVNTARNTHAEELQRINTEISVAK